MRSLHASERALLENERFPGHVFCTGEAWPKSGRLCQITPVILHGGVSPEPGVVPCARDRYLPLGGRPLLYEKRIRFRLDGNEIYYTACSLLVILKNSCSKLHCQKVLIEFPFHTSSYPFCLLTSPPNFTNQIRILALSISALHAENSRRVAQRPVWNPKKPDSSGPL